MRQFTLGIEYDRTRPVLRLRTFKGYRALLDTGAVVPLWTNKEFLLADELDGTLVKKNVVIEGLGGSATGNLYELPVVQLGDLVYPSFHIVSCPQFENEPYDLILSATMLDHLIYEIDTKHHKLNIEIPDEESNVRDMRVTYESGRWVVFCQSAVCEEDCVEDLVGIGGVTWDCGTQDCIRC